MERSKPGHEIKIECWRLDRAGRTLVLASYDGSMPGIVHFGASLPLTENLEMLARAAIPAVAGGQLDPVVPPSLFPGASSGWQGHPGIRRDPAPAPWRVNQVDCEVDGDHIVMDFELDNKPGNPGLANGHVDLTLTENGLMDLSFHLNDDYSLEECHFSWLAMSVPVPDHLDRIIDHGGRWCGEFRRQERRFSMGAHVREGLEGRTGHGDFPGMVFASDDCSENSGECLGVSLKWSGGWKAIAQEMPDGRRQVQLGQAFSGEADKVSLLVGYSQSGLNGLSRMFQSEIRDALPGKSQRLVHYNCWEAVYFRHSVDELKEIASRAAEMGAERFVLDDGWFKGRNDDTTSLGDWVVDTAKYPDGFHPLIDHVHSLGMDFGLWFEPEMISLDSDLYRENPHWLLGDADQPSGRNQFVLDLCNEKVADYLYDRISLLLATYPINYIKWDHNRILPVAEPGQTQALYRLLQRFNVNYPHVEIESCASGGGRIDPGILEHANRVWLSDSNDALERVRMQHEASRWLPAEVQGSHVGPRVCHTSGRILPMMFRALVAAQRHMGIEMDPRELTEEEADVLKRVIGWYKDNREFMFAALHYRLDSVDPQMLGEVFVAEDQSRFVMFLARTGTSQQIASRTVRIPGLAEGGLYKLSCFNGDEPPPILNRNQAFSGDQGQISLSGGALGSGAFRPPNLFPNSMLLYEGRLTQ